MIPSPIKETALNHVWRLVRLFGVTFGHAAWVGLIHLQWPQKTAVLAAVVGATEVAYRQAFPPGSQRLVAGLAGFAAKELLAGSSPLVGPVSAEPAPTTPPASAPTPPTPAVPPVGPATTGEAL